MALLLSWSATPACGRVGYELEAASSAGGAHGVSGGAPGAGGTSLVDAGAGGREASAGGAATGGLAEAGTGGAIPPDATPEASRPDAAPDAREASIPMDASDATSPPVCTRPLEAPDYCSTIPALPAEPVIDGALDCGVTLRALDPVGWNTAEPQPVGETARYAVAYRPDGLYFYVVVQDPSLIPADALDQAWQGDGVELYVDADGVFPSAPVFDNPGTRQVQVVAPPDAVTSGTRGQLFTCGFDTTRLEWLEPRFIAVPTPGGYAVEAFVTAAELAIPTWSLTAGARVGTSVGINVSLATRDVKNPSQGYRAGQYFVRIVEEGGLPGPFQNTDAFCLPTLAAP